MLSVLESYADRPWLQIHPNIDFPDFWGLLAVADVLMGNSSAGVMESASFRIPTINIGTRQAGRLRAENVINADHDRNAIAQAIDHVLRDDGYRQRLAAVRSPYGDGNASEKIVEIIKSLELDEKLIEKHSEFSLQRMDVK